MSGAALTAGLFLGLARVYTASQGLEVDLTGQVVVASVLGASSLAVRAVPAQNPAVRALTTGSVFAGAMYLLGNDSDLVTHAVLGTVCAYAAEVILPENPVEKVNEFEF